MKRYLIIVCAFVSLVFLYSASSSHAALAGKVSLAQGRVDVLKPGKNMAVPVKAGDPVDVGDIYRAKSDGKAEITFINGNILKIASNTRAEIKEAMFEGNKSNNVIKLHRGRVQAISGADFIKKAASFAEDNRFEVHTPNAVAGIRGSNMIVSYLQRITGTIFIAGRGYQYNPNDPDKRIVAITAGTISFVTSPTGSATPPRSASEAEIAIQVNAMATPAPGSSDNTTPSTAGQTTGTTTTYTPVSFTPYTLPYIPPVEPTPTPTPAPTTVDYTGNLTGGNFYDDNFNPSSTGSITATMTGSIANGVNIGTADFTGTYQNPETRKIWSGGIEGPVNVGETPKGAFLGYAGGSWTSWSGNVIGLLVEDGKIGFLTTSPSGASVATGAFTGSGDLVRRLIEETTLTPTGGQSWLDALKGGVTTDTFTTTDSGQWTIGDATFSASKRKADTTLVKSEHAGGNTIGVIREMLSGTTYNNPTHVAQSGLYGETLGDAFYSIGEASLADDAFHKKLTMNIENMYMNTRSVGGQSVYYEGTYDAPYYSPYRMIGIGTIEGAPLIFVSKVSEGRFQGLFGGVWSLWTEDPVLATFMGKLVNTGLQNVGLSQISSYDYVKERHMTYDGGAYRGLIGTAKFGEDAAMARQAALYIAPDGSGGYLFSDLFGVVYESAGNMFYLNGIAYAQQVKTSAELGIAPQDLYAGTSVGTMDGTGAYLEGFFTNWQQISGQESVGYTMALKNLNTHAGENWGVYGIALYGTYTTPTTEVWTGAFGGPGSFGEYYSNGQWLADSGYWLMSVDDEEGAWTGTWNDGCIGGAARGRFITRKKIGAMSGNVLGSFNGVNEGNGTWELASVGTWESDPLKAYSPIAANFRYYDGETKQWQVDGSILGVLGGPDGVWYVPSLMLGRYIPGSETPAPSVWVAPVVSFNWDTGQYTTMGLQGWGAHYGYAVGTRVDAYTAGKFYGVYIGGEAPYNAGLIYDADLNGIIYPGSRMIEMTGGFNRVEMDANVGIAPQDLVTHITSSLFYPDIASANASLQINGNAMGDAVGRPYTYEGEIFNIDGRQWGVWRTMLGGSYAGITPSDVWDSIFEYNDGTLMFGQYIRGNVWNEKHIGGSTIGAGASLENGSTWIAVGETIGTYNPDLTTFQTVSIGVGIGTERYLAMVDSEAGRAALNALNVPCVEVGSVNLAQSDTNPNLYNVSMNGVRFFGTQAGGAPTIWATQSVNGNYIGNPLNQTVAMTGGGLNADFTMKGWDTGKGKWTAGIVGSGTLNGGGAAGAYNGAIQFRGVGAGSINQGAGSFTGAAAGGARPTQAQ